MIKLLKQRLHKDHDEGFTLIELLVVVLILGILMAIAIPTFLSLTSGAKTSAAEADLTTAAQDEAAYLTTNGSFDTASTTAATVTTDNVAAMKAADAGINWVATTPVTAGQKQVAIVDISNTSAAPILYLATKASDGNFYYVYDNAGTLTYTETSVLVASPGPAGAGSSTAANSDWVTSWKGLPTTIPAT